MGSSVCLLHSERQNNRMRVLYTSLVLCGLFSIAISVSDKAKNIAIFNVVKFQNTECTGGNNNPGTCYTTEECEDRKGTADGTCAGAMVSVVSLKLTVEDH